MYKFHFALLLSRTIVIVRNRLANVFFWNCVKSANNELYTKQLKKIYIIIIIIFIFSLLSSHAVNMAKSEAIKLCYYTRRKKNEKILKT